MDKRDAPRAETLEQIIQFTAGGEEYGIDIRKVKEVVFRGEITPLPGAPPFVKGVINLRGEVIPIVDLREKLGLPTMAEGEASRIIVAEIGEKLVGLVVDVVSRVMRIASGQLESAPPGLGGPSSQSIAGVVQSNGRLIVVLDIELILTSGERLELNTINERKG